MKKKTKMFISILSLLIGIVSFGSELSAKAIEDKSRLTDAKIMPTEKIVYLTFDDGPTGAVTEQILDVLKQQQVKATFFVVGKEITQREKVLQRIYEEGHGIGLHTYSHNLKKIYSSPEYFMEEMKQTEEKINKVLGQNLDLKVIRFPGGSAGRLNEEFLLKLHQNNYKIFDWNVSIEDGVNPDLATSRIVENAKKHQKDAHVIIVLAHCNSNNKTTYLALPDIIKYYKEQGFTFKSIDNNTPEYYYKIKKITK
ncbi:MAG: polysaccharide deacetylase family protein [Cellulosilyticaceae bacterium]